MAYIKYTWKDRVSDYPNRRTLTPVTGSVPNLYDVTPSEGTVIEPGDQWDATNMNNLEDRIGTMFPNAGKLSQVFININT